MSNRDEIIRELEDIAPLLSKIKPVNEGSVPIGYFENFSSALLEKVRKEAVIEELSLLSSSLPPSRAPVSRDLSSYFEQLPQQMLSIVKQENISNKKNTWVDKINDFFTSILILIDRPALAWAGSGAFALVFVTFMLLKEPIVSTCPESDPICMLEKVSDAELNAYLLNHEDDFEKSTLDYSMDDKLLKTNADDITGNMNDLFKQLENESIEAYTLD